jgi:transposase
VVGLVPVAIPLERGITVPQTRGVLDTRLRDMLADESNGLSPRMRRLIEDLREEWRDFDRRIEAIDAELVEFPSTMKTAVG